MNQYRIRIHMSNGDGHRDMYLRATSAAHAVAQAMRWAIKQEWEVKLIEVDDD